jgi:HSP20 family protein
MSELDRIRRDLDDVFGAGANRVFSSERTGRGLFDRDVSPSLDVIERADEFVIRVDLPGVNQEDLDVTVANNVVTIKGEKKGSSEHKEGKLYRKETWEGSFQRTVGLPSGTQADGIEAAMRDGVLEITVPKQEEAKPRQIAVNVK